MTEDQQCVVVGAGIVGLACAYSLASSGYRPLVIDADKPGSGASSGNAGWIVFAPDLVAPVPGPGVVRTSLRWLVQRDSPLHLVPRIDSSYLRWLAAFLLSCNRRTAAAGLRATLALNAGSAELFDALERDGLEFEMECLGVLVVYRRRQDFELARARLEGGDERGTRARILSGDEALAAEPLLRSDACVGAIHYHADRHVRPEKLVEALVQRLERMGIEMRTQSPCIGVIRDGRRIVGVRTPTEIIRARTYVFAAGAAMSEVARHAGVRLPVEGGRGYSFDVARDELPVRTPVYVYDARLALTPFREHTRVVGMMELGARDATVRRRAIETMNRLGADCFRSWPATDTRDAWAGLRPMTPDGLPVIGGVEGIQNLYFAGGHGMLGVTLSLRTGEAIAEYLQHDGAIDPRLRPFAPSRLARTAHL